jgi:hypothetical protein
MAITSREGLNQSKSVVFILEIDIASSRFSRSSSKTSDDETSTEARQKGKIAQNLSEKIMAPWMFDVKFLYDTQFTFGPLTFATGEDGNLKMLLQGQHHSTSHRYMDKLHVFQSSHLHQAVLA